ncbi:rhodanese-like domain-containing protein [Paenibacillus thailandensis]|uniref:Rhodanese-like domain-containing protein n=1 Tax=Paenibacillus thailandensis TaxID=393250 RepID=A0ABW5R0T6_9BACL
MDNWYDVEPRKLLELVESGEIKEDQIIDVREPEEWHYYHLPGSTHIPMNTLPYALDRLPADKPLYIVCAHGVRSVAVCRYLAEIGGFGHGLYNVEGGMASIASLRGFDYD